MLLTASKKPDFVYFWYFSRKQNQTSTAVLLVPSQFFVWSERSLAVIIRNRRRVWWSAESALNPSVDKHTRRVIEDSCTSYTAVFFSYAVLGNVIQNCRTDEKRTSLRFSEIHELWSSNAAFIIAFYAAVNHNEHKQRTLKQRNTQNGSKSTNNKSQTMTFWTR